MRQVKSKVIFFEVKRIARKEFALAGQTVNSAYCCQILLLLRENVRRLRSEFWQQMNWLLHHDDAPFHTFIFSEEFFLPKTLLSGSRVSV
jgi:hypothetical protein